MHTYLMRCSTLIWLTLVSAAPGPMRGQELRQSGLDRASEEPQIPTPVDEAWTKQLETILAESELPALWAGKYYRDGRSVAAAVGVRKVGHDCPVEIDDKLHLGSCTKAMTATLVAKAVSSGKLRWETTLGEVFTEHAELQVSEWRHVTLTELIQHRSGAPANGLWQALHAKHPTDVIASRRALLDWLVKKKRPKQPTFLYSNVGYAVLGHVLEQAEQRSWEKIIDEQLFAPLRIASAGFGPVLDEIELKQPWGHVESPSLGAAFGKVVDAVQGNSTTTPRDDLKPIRIDNPPPLGPAGRVHMSLGDWSQFANLFATTDPPPTSLGIDPQDWDKLLDPTTTTSAEPDPGNYAGGWIIDERDWAGGRILNHAGSNTTWFCVAWVAPQKEYCILVASNSFTTETPAVCDRVVGELVGIDVE